MCVSISDFFPDVTPKKWTTHLGQFSGFFPDVWFIPKFRTISGSKNCSVPDVLFKKIIVPDVMLEKRKCPRCVVQRFWMMQMSQMSCSEHFQKNHCPRCVLQKRHCPRCHVLNISKKTTVPDVCFKKTYCPRCVVPKKTLSLSQMSAPKTLLSQMSCSEHFQKNHCPRCVLQKNPLSQMCGPKKPAIPDVWSKNCIVSAKLQCASRLVGEVIVPLKLRQGHLILVL